jgi:hypothetical protein
MKNVNFDSPSVQSYLGILQGVINRMALNSSGCKTWCITLVSAIIVIIADKGKPEFIWISVVPIALFWLLDAYYLGMERRFRDVYDRFIKKLHAEEAKIDDIYIVALGAGAMKTFCSTASAFISVSVLPFYGLLAFMLFVVKRWVL